MLYKKNRRKYILEAKWEKCFKKEGMIKYVEYSWKFEKEKDWKLTRGFGKMWVVDLYTISELQSKLILGTKAWLQCVQEKIGGEK